MAWIRGWISGASSCRLLVLGSCWGLGAGSPLTARLNLFPPKQSPRGRCRVHMAGDLHFYMRHSLKARAAAAAAADGTAADSAADVAVAGAQQSAAGGAAAGGTKRGAAAAAAGRAAAGGMTPSSSFTHVNEVEGLQEVWRQLSQEGQQQQRQQQQQRHAAPMQPHAAPMQPRQPGGGSPHVAFAESPPKHRSAFSTVGGAFAALATAEEEDAGGAGAGRAPGRRDDSSSSCSSEGRAEAGPHGGQQPAGDGIVDVGGARGGSPSPQRDRLSPLLSEQAHAALPHHRRCHSGGSASVGAAGVGLRASPSSSPARRMTDSDRMTDATTRGERLNLPRLSIDGASLAPAGAAARCQSCGGWAGGGGADRARVEPHRWDPEHLIVNGAGGAFLHPTHVFRWVGR